MQVNTELKATRGHHPSAAAGTNRMAVWIPALSAALYPWLLDAFHRVVSAGGADALSTGRTTLAGLLLLAAFAVPLCCLLMAGCPRAGKAQGGTRARRFALLAMTAPTLYVFFGVLTYMAGSSIPDPWLWTPAWLLLGVLASRSGGPERRFLRRPSARLRVMHGICGAIATLYVLFHLFNHLFGLIGPEAHAQVMAVGRVVYRATLIEPLLVAVMLFQVVSGLRLAWVWSETSADRYRVFQVASGVFMAVFIVGHMNSVFIFARTWLDIPTDWAFASGQPSGLIADAWNIRLLPHYALGVFFVLAHLCSGLRLVLLAHKCSPARANQFWWLGAGISALISAAIVCGLTGLRLG